MRRLAGLLLLFSAAAGLPESIVLWKSSPELVTRCAHTIPPSNAERFTVLRKMFESAECRDKGLAEQTVAGTEQKNLICTMEGRSLPVILIAAHYELEGNGASAVDDWSGAVLLPLLSKALHATVPRHTFVLVEFAGAKGAKTFLGSLSKQQRRNIVGAVGLEALGVGPVRFWTSPYDDGVTFARERVMAMVLGEAANMLGQRKRPQFDLVPRSLKVDDTAEFRRAGVPAMTIQSLNEEGRKLPRSAEDTAQAIDEKVYYDAYLLLCAYFGRLDQIIDGVPPGGRESGGPGGRPGPR